MPDKPKVLAVDDQPQNVYLLERLLTHHGIDVYKALSGAEALNLVLEHDFCVAIVDIQMPEMNGYELVELLRSNKDTSTLPVIFVSAIYSDEYHHRKAYDSGAVDFMSKPFITDILISKVKVFIELYNKRRGLQDLVEQLNGSNAVLSKRAMQLETSGQVGRQIASILNQTELLVQLVNLLKTRFGYYFVSVWLLNDAEDAIVLKASTQELEAMPVGYSLPLDFEKSIVVRVCRQEHMYLTTDALNDENYLSVKGLPLTRSELVLPLKFGQRILGALDIESDQVGAFASDDVTTLQIVADQVAIAIRNASLYSQVVRFNEHLEELVAQRTVELQKAYQVLEKLDKSKADFITVAAHELRTPLTLIRGYTEMLQDMLAERSDATPLVQGIRSGESRLLEVVNSMLDVSRIDSSSLSVVKGATSLQMVIEEVCAGFANALEERSLSLSLSGLGKLPLINADPDLIQKLFIHLVVNAIKYTPDGGRITVSGQVIEQAVNGGQPSKFVQVTVSDTGIGIHPEEQEMVFEKFYQTGQVNLHSTGRTKFKGGGPGLGLAIARGIVQVHGGRIWVESPGYDEEKLPGSAFHVLLPVGDIDMVPA